MSKTATVWIWIGAEEKKQGREGGYTIVDAVAVIGVVVLIAILCIVGVILGCFRGCECFIFK